MTLKQVFFLCFVFFAFSAHSQTSLNDELAKVSIPTNFRPERIKELIEKGADVDSLNKWGNTSLIMAVVYKNKPLVEFLMKKGADPHYKNKKGFSALDFAKRLKKDDLIRVLEGEEEQIAKEEEKKPKEKIKARWKKPYSNIKSKINSGPSRKKRPKSKKKEMSEKTPEKVIERPKESESGETLSLKGFLSQSEFDPKKIKEAITQGANLETKSDQDETAVFWAVKKKDIGLFEWLVKEGALLIHKNKDGETIKDLAIKAKWFKMRKWVNFYLKFRFLQSTEKKLFNSEHIKKFVKMGVPLDDKNLEGETPLTASLKAKDKDTFDFLLDNKADPGVSNSKGVNALNMVRKGIFSDLLDKTEQMAKDSELRKYLKIVHFDSEKVKAAIEKGANINTVDSLGNSALIISVIKKNKELIKYLVEKKADKTIKNTKGNNARFFTKGNKAIKNLLSGVEEKKPKPKEEKPKKEEVKVVEEPEIPDEEDPVDSSVNLSSEDLKTIGELYKEASDWGSSASDLDDDKLQTTHSFAFNLAVATKKLTRPLDVTRQLGPNVIDLAVKVQSQQVRNGIRETIVDVYITNKTNTPFSILIEFSNSGVDPHYCPTNKEVFLPPRETVLQNFDVLSDGSVSIDHIIVAKASQCPREPLLRASNHLKEKPKVTPSKEKACHHISDDIISYEEVVEVCKKQVKFEKGEYTGTFPHYKFKNKSILYAKFQANKIAKKNCRKKPGYVISTIMRNNKIKKCEKGSGLRFSCSASTSVACLNPNVKKTTFYKKDILKNVKDLLEKIVEGHKRISINKPNDINDSFNELNNLARIQLNKIDYIETILNEKDAIDKKKINCATKVFLTSFWKFASKAYPCMKGELFKGIPASGKVIINPLMRKTIKFPLSIIK